jgi:hypothetical protein
MSKMLERGDIFFFYRPRVDATEADDVDDVQRFFIVLKPDGRRLFRELVVGRKRLPDPGSHEREWAFVDDVMQSPSKLKQELQSEVYETKTRGLRVEPEARPAGEGRYALVDHDGHTHLAYALELPRRRGPVQKAFRIEREASYILAIRNPASSAPPGAGLPTRRRADYPRELLELFGHRRFVPANPPELLDYEGAEIVLIGGARDAERELGIDLDLEEESLEEADLFKKLRLRPDEVPTEPLAKGAWR